MKPQYPHNITDVRLVGGTGPYDGRVEVQINDDWGTVCGYSIGSYDADTLCKSMGFKLTRYSADPSVYGQGTGAIYIGYMRCYATNTHVNQCSYNLPPRRRYCSHSRDISLVCTPCGKPLIQFGSYHSFNGTVLTAKCDVGYQPENITFDCLANGTWMQNDKCSSKYSYPLEISDLKIVNRYGHHEGRVEIQVDGIWGTICSNNFTMAEANVICQMIGLEASHIYTDTGGDGPVFISNLQCHGNESHINNCSYNVNNDCLYTQSAGVYCTGYQLNVTGWRLAGTNGPYHGRVELEVNGTWGTICSRGFYGWPSADVICNMFALRYYDYYYNAYYGQGEGPIYMESLHCSRQSYTDINDCKYVANNYHGVCSHANDLSVMCFGPSLNITDVRLTNGTGPDDGRAEIKISDTWGTICDSNFALRDAEVFCKMLGLKAVRFFTGALYGEGNGPVYIDQLFCDSSDAVLSDCQYLFLNECSHSRDVSIVCNECGEPDNSHWDAGYFTYNGSTLYADCSYYKTYLGILKMTCDNVNQTWKAEGECQEYA
ncbi:scavenger receptor cysteine-rich type 1 protein M130-like [Ruditapes philippinarum]|uniref:scavenger receptor cysteine-rich type 1 protein M130-like n=1 Tax=Ruditapes philippinarum TaxID=129788 RepID=UPI00295C35AC|nr:scavenger receptor cysteine-rich type 1 protein M130-like [Ruditapes philippinarum]